MKPELQNTLMASERANEARANRACSNGSRLAKYAIVFVLLGFFAFQSVRPFLLNAMDATYSMYRDSIYGCARTQVWLSTAENSSTLAPSDEEAFQSGVSTQEAGDEFWSCEGNVNGLVPAPVQPSMPPVEEPRPVSEVSWARLPDLAESIFEVDRSPLLQPPQV